MRIKWDNRHTCPSTQNAQKYNALSFLSPLVRFPRDPGSLLLCNFESHSSFWIFLFISKNGSNLTMLLCCEDENGPEEASVRLHHQVLLTLNLIYFLSFTSHPLWTSAPPGIFSSFFSLEHYVLTTCWMLSGSSANRHNYFELVIVTTHLWSISYLI